VPIIQVQIGKNMVDNVLLDEGANVNIITEQLRIKLDLLKPNPAPNHLKMVVLNNVQTTKIIQILKIYIHGIPYVVDPSYSMLIKCSWLRAVKVTLNYRNNVIII
jgi:hypothetical protein